MRDSGEVKDSAHFRKYDRNKLVIAHLNINSLTNKVELLTEKAKANADILLISGTKIDESFPDIQFNINSFNKPYRVDHNEKRGGIMLLFRKDFPVKVLSVDNGNEICYVEVIPKKTKWLINHS